HRKLRLAWTAPGARADAALGVLQAAALHGLDPATYGPRSLDLERQQLESPEAGETQRDARSVAFDARLTNALISLGRDVAVGRRPPRLLDQQWRAARRLPDLAFTLAQAAEAGELSGWLDAIRPRHEGYRALQAALARLRAGAGSGPWPDVPAVAVA